MPSLVYLCIFTADSQKSFLTYCSLHNIVTKPQTMSHIFTFFCLLVPVGRVTNFLG